MPFCKVYENTVGEDFFSFEGFFQKGDDIIYAAVKSNSEEYEYYCSVEPFDVRGGRALYRLLDYLAIGSKEHYDTAVFKYNNLYGYVNTNSGKIIASVQFADAQRFGHTYARVCYADGRSGLIDKKGNIVEPVGYNDVWDYSDGVFIVRKRFTSFPKNISLWYGAVDADGNILVDFDWNLLSCRDGWDGYIACHSGVGFGDGTCRYFFLDKEGKEHGRYFTEPPKKRVVSGTTYWHVTRGSKHGIMREDGTFMFDVTLSRRAVTQFFEKKK